VLRYFSEETALRDALGPTVPGFRKRRPLPGNTPAAVKRRGRVALLEGCVAPLLLGDANHATLRVLVDQGFDVVVPMARTCCGALAAHFGQLDVARKAALRTIRAFRTVGAVDAIVSNSAGCGAMLKEYERLLADADGAAPEDVNAAREFAARVKDVSEFLVEAGLRPPAGRVTARVAYADACHLLHAQRVGAAPRALLGAIPGVELVALDRAERCCGAAGLYGVLNPRESAALIESKLDDLERAKVDVLATANPGCLLQWRAGVERRGLAVEVLHPLELFDRAGRAGRVGQAGPLA
jgi:glycolate oxidase iron-sulfur subunit